MFGEIPNLCAAVFFLLVTVTAQTTTTTKMELVRLDLETFLRHLHHFKFSEKEGLVCLAQLFTTRQDVTLTDWIQCD